jgi:hypothetical protein
MPGDHYPGAHVVSRRRSWANWRSPATGLPQQFSQQKAALKGGLVAIDEVNLGARWGKHMRAVLSPFLRCFSILILMTQAVLSAPVRDPLTGVQFDLPEKWSALDISSRKLGWFKLYRMPRSARSVEAMLPRNQPDCFLSTEFGATINGMNIRDPDYPAVFKLRYGARRPFDVLSIDRFVRGETISVIFVRDYMIQNRIYHRQSSALLSSYKYHVIITCYTNPGYLGLLEDFEAIYRSVKFPK